MNEFLTDNIDTLRATPLTQQAGWRITFRSPHAGRCHQLYVNGALADWTDTPAGRTFLLDGDYAPAVLAVAAVEADDRREDFAALLPAEASQPDWVLDVQVIREPVHRPGDRAQVIDDGTVLSDALLWPVWMPRWTFGEDAFGLGGFGYDGYGAVGMTGLFGVGPFGFDLDAVSLPVTLAEEGTHVLTARTLATDGQAADGDDITIAATPPPTPVECLSVAAYDPATDTLTLRIESE